MINYTDIANRAYKGSHYIFSDFLSLSEQEDCLRESRDFPVKISLWGGYENSERKMVCFGSKDDFYYEEAFPMVCLKISPLAEKFAKEVSHRDYLGALMNLGLERKCYGDIVVDGKSAYVFVAERIADYVCENLTSIGHNTIKVERAEYDDSAKNKDGMEAVLMIPSMRVDAIIASAYKLSRKEANTYFFEKRVSVDGRLCENNDKVITGCSTISVRGKGKLVIKEIGGTTKKGRQVITVELFK